MSCCGGMGVHSTWVKERQDVEKGTQKNSYKNLCKRENFLRYKKLRTNNKQLKYIYYLDLKMV